ncbi:MAG: hypothetical protein ABJG88_02000 [Litorimonas sp.]
MTKLKLKTFFAVPLVAIATLGFTSTAFASNAFASGNNAKVTPKFSQVKTLTNTSNIIKLKPAVYGVETGYQSANYSYSHKSKLRTPYSKPKVLYHSKSYKYGYKPVYKPVYKPKLKTFGIKSHSVKYKPKRVYKY